MKQLFKEKNRWEKSESALMVIDMQVDFVSDNGYLARNGINMAPVQSSIWKIGAVIERARKSGMPVIYTKTVHEKCTDSPVWRSRYYGKSAGTGICAAGTEGTEIVRDLAPHQEDPVVTKHRYDAMIGTDLPTILRSLKAERIFIAGTQTNLCVDSTARHLFMEDYETVIIEECVSTPYDDLHEPFLKNFHQNFGEVSPLDRVMKYMEKY